MMTPIKTVRALELCHVGWDSKNTKAHDAADCLLSYTVFSLRKKEFVPPEKLWHEIAILSDCQKNPESYPANRVIEEK